MPALIVDPFTATAVLAGAAMALSLILGIAIGAVAAAYRGRAADNLLLVISLALVSIPVFWLGTMLLIAVAASIRSFPLGGYNGATRFIPPTPTPSPPSAGFFFRLLSTPPFGPLHSDFLP